MIKKEDLIFGSVIELEDHKFPAIINGSNENETVFNIIGIKYTNGIPELTREKIVESSLERCHPAKFDVPTPFVKFRNYDIIVESLKKKGYAVIRNNNNTRTVLWTDADIECKEVFNEVHLFQKFIHDKINEYLEVEL